MYRTPCPNCGHRLKYTDEHLGRKARCQKCAHRFSLPTNPPEARSSPSLGLKSDSPDPPPATFELASDPPRPEVEAGKETVSAPAPNPTQTAKGASGGPRG